MCAIEQGTAYTCKSSDINTLRGEDVTLCHFYICADLTVWYTIHLFKARAVL